MEGLCRKAILHELFSGRSSHSQKCFGLFSGPDLMMSFFCLIRFSLSSHAVCFWVGRALRLSLLASANGCERDLVGK